MKNVFLPINSVGDYACYSISSNGEYIRAYKQQPHNNSSSNYTDFYINSHYLEVPGTQSWSQYSTLPVCMDTSVITTDFYYRNDMPGIMVMFLIMSIFCFYIPIKIFSKLFKRGAL